MDAVARYNQERWGALVNANAIFTRPYLDLDASSAQAIVDPAGRFGKLQGQRVLCLAGGGGQQSAAFALLGAQVTVFDLSADQLARDQAAAAHYGLSLTILQGDMRDLTPLVGQGFDLVYHPYSLNFVPDARVVFAQVGRVIRAGGHYSFNCANPCFAGLLIQEWDGRGYPLHRSYVQGAEIRYVDEAWIFRGEPPTQRINGPVEYRQTLSTLVNGLVEAGFVITHLEEEFLGEPDPAAPPGTSAHFSAVAPPWLRFWAVFMKR
jgi:SAM-dependent methyltransferase